MTARTRRTRAEPYVPSILVVDDDPQIRTLFRRILEEAGYLVIDAASGRDAHKAASEWLFELMILDLSMPHEDGFEVIRAMRTSAPDLKILVVSDFMGGRMLPVAIKLGAAATMNKAEARDRLLVQVCQLLAEPY